MTRIFLEMFLTVKHNPFHLPTAAMKGCVTDSEKAVRKHPETASRVKESAEIFVLGLDLKRGRLVFYQEAHTYVRG